jgi:hypothetical protein
MESRGLLQEESHASQKPQQVPTSKRASQVRAHVKAVDPLRGVARTEAVDSCKKSRTHRKSRSKYQRARKPHKYARTSKPWIHRGVARTKAATVQTTSNRECTSASKSRAADLIAYARIWFGGAKDPTRPSEHERYG